MTFSLHQTAEAGRRAAVSGTVIGHSSRAAERVGYGRRKGRAGVRMAPPDLKPIAVDRLQGHSHGGMAGHTGREKSA